MKLIFNKKDNCNSYKGWVALLIFISYYNGENLYAQSNSYPLIRTSQNVTVNKKMPNNVLAAGEIMPAKFSKSPTDEEIYRVHFFEEPLVPIAKSETKGENKALILSLAAYSQRKSPDDFTAITGFLHKYPTSRWRGALLANLGLVYRRTGYYSLALETWQQAWDILKKQDKPQVKLLADKVIAELLLINSWVGRKTKIDSLFGEIGNRVIEGSAVEKVSSMRRAVWLMENDPGFSFMCGPFALDRIYTSMHPGKPLDENLKNLRSNSKGFSLYELETFANQAGMNYQMAFRNPGAVIITNTVVHWKLNHYSALINSKNNYYQCEDATAGTTYGKQFWLSTTALDSSASGYFLVPAGTLPAGWRTVSPEEGTNIYGKGEVPPDDGKNTSDDDDQQPEPCDPPSPMAQSNVHSLAVSLHIYDRPIYYQPPVGPAMNWKVNYHQKETYQPSNFSYSNFGPKWTFNWLSYVQDNPVFPSDNADVYQMGGGVITFYNFNDTTQRYRTELKTNGVLVRICPTCYELRHPDGSKEVYSRPDGNTSAGRKIFLTKKIDAAGNVMNILYDANLRVVALKDTLGQITTINYENSSDIYKITKVIDPFGRSASFDYDEKGRLKSITDMIGIVSSFKYNNSDFVLSMTTPYGTTSFTKDDGPGNFRSLETTYPLGEKERVEFADYAPGLSINEPVPQNMNLDGGLLFVRNTFYWDKKAMKEAPGDYSKAKILHWLHGADIGRNLAGPILESVKMPLENRVWYRYANQTIGSIWSNQGMSSKPSLVGRVLDDGTTQLSKYASNELGNDTLVIDPTGRTFKYIYDTTKINLLEIRQVKNNANEVLSKFTYNSQHLPLTSTDASGLTTTYTYNPMGQLLTIKNPKNEITTFTYNSSGYLQNIKGPVNGSTISFGYDAFGRVRTVTDQEGYTVTTDYDVLDRPTIITYPDSTYEQIVYDRLDAVHRRDRLGRWSHTVYDSLRRPTIMTDALNRITQYIWCSCGSLSEIIDPLKNVTSFTRDIQGRVIAKTYSDGKSNTYKYENTTSRLKETTDAKGQKKQYSYFADGNLKQISYANAIVATPSVSFTYDSIYKRVSTMTDGTGTTAYAYKAINSGLGSGMLGSVDGPLANDVIAYTYDSLGRVLSHSINGVASSVVYDALGRVVSANNALGNFVYSYVNQTGRLASMSYPNGQTTSFSYFPNNSNKRLSQIWNKTSVAATISKFDYEYNSEGQITEWTQQAGAATPTYLTVGYDLADQLIAATQKNQSSNAIIKRYAYQYDKVGNRTNEQIDNSATSSVYKEVNQLTSQSGTGQMRFTGTVNEFATVQVKNQTTADSAIATVDTSNIFQAFVKTAVGTNNIAIKAIDFSGNNNTSTSNYNINVTAGTANTITYDDNGNTIFTSTPGTTYDWDAADRLVKIINANGTTEFVYDGLSRRVAEKLNGIIIKRWLWDGKLLVEERDAAGSTFTKRFFKQGEQIGSTKYFYAQDHLGSIREVTDINGAVQARYDYDPFGRRTRVTGTIDADLGFTGHYYHTNTKLYLTLYRAYDANLGRWLNRDPINEKGGLNLYSYVNRNPLNKIDRLGLLCDDDEDDEEDDDIDNDNPDSPSPSRDPEVKQGPPPLPPDPDRIQGPPYLPGPPIVLPPIPEPGKLPDNPLDFVKGTLELTAGLVATVYATEALLVYAGLAGAAAGAIDIYESW